MVEGSYAMNDLDFSYPRLIPSMAVNSFEEPLVKDSLR